jgi:hypothetical protein
MSPANDRDDELTPDRAIRRFDVFAEYSRQERQEKGYPEDEAKGYGIWLAKVVAARRFGARTEPFDRAKPSARRGEPAEEPKFRSVGDELQTDETFDHDIIERMGPKFYNDIFVPAIAEAREKGESYESLRDEIRKSWKPARSKSR